MKKIGVFTSGGDAPGMNAAIRAVVRASVFHGIEVMGIMRGYEGMIDGDFIELKSHSVSNIIQRGGTILKSARSERFFDAAFRRQAFSNLRKHNLDGAVAIGGDGTFRGALALFSETGFPFLGIPGTIDNDLYGTDFTLGYDTAINTAVDAIDKIRDTADAHERLFFVEVMGRDAGFIALRCGIAGGAEAILVPEYEASIDKLIKTLETGWRKNKTSSIVVVAEAGEIGRSLDIQKEVNKRFAHYETRVVILGHMQRGGSPTTMDRVLASTLGVASVEALMRGEKNVMAGLVNKAVVLTPLEKATKHHHTLNPELMRIAEILSV
jgi:6-phosphofructokinase 1